MPTKPRSFPLLGFSPIGSCRQVSPGFVIVLTATLVVSGCRGCIRSSWYTVPAINKQVPTSLLVTGPATITPGASATFTLTVTYANPISATNNFIVRAAIFEDDIGDVRLDRSVQVRFPANATSGSATFTLTCVDDGQGNLLIRGDDGSNTYDPVWEIFAWIPDQDTSQEEEGPNANVSCKPD
jgi:hypothetical protein